MRISAWVIRWGAAGAIQAFGAALLILDFRRMTILETWSFGWFPFLFVPATTKHVNHRSCSNPPPRPWRCCQHRRTQATMPCFCVWLSLCQVASWRPWCQSRWSVEMVSQVEKRENAVGQTRRQYILTLFYFIYSSPAFQQGKNYHWLIIFS